MNSTLSVDALRHVLVSTDRDEDSDARALLPATGDRFDALKTALRRKRKRPPTSLTPLDSPQHTHRTADVSDARNDDHDHDIAAAVASKALGNEPSASPIRQQPLSPLAPLIVNVLERKRLFLRPDGEPVVGIEEILQLQEPLPLDPASRVRASPLQLVAVPRKVFDDDEVALMPCHSLHYRYVPSLEVEKWKEPLRDRDKDWRDDELAMLLATHGRHAAVAETKMTRGMPGGNVRKGTWRKLDSQRLQIKSSASTRTALSSGTAIVAPVTAVAPVATTATAATASAVSTAMTSPRDASLPSEVLLRVQGAMISQTYCVVTIYGIGIYGRLYSEGLADRAGASARFLRIDAYDPSTSRTTSLRVSLTDLEWVFEAHPDLLAPGRKQTVLTKVVALLYFQYPDALARDTLPVLCISPNEKLNEAARRRREREERLRREEEERLRLLALLLALPRRARHRVACQLTRVSGRAFLISVYQFPSHVRNFLVVAYEPRSSRTLTLSVGVHEAAALRSVVTPPHTWSRELKTQLATALLPKLFLKATKSKFAFGLDDDSESGSYRVALAIREDRAGSPGAWLALPLVAHADARKHDVVAKFAKDGAQELRLTLEQTLATLEHDAATTADALRTQITQADATVLTLQRRDLELQDLIEDINSSKPTGESTPKSETHERRRQLKAARKALKDERRALETQVVAWKRELERVREHERSERDRALATFDRQLALLTQRAETATLSLWFDPLRDRSPRVGMTQCGGNTQRRRLVRAEIHAHGVVLASGACVLDGRRQRYAVVGELPARTDDASVKGDQDEQEDEERLTERPTGIEWFTLTFYDAKTNHMRSLRLARLEWLSFTKAAHGAQLAVAALGVATAPVVQQVAALDASYEATRRTLAALPLLTKKHEKKRRTLTATLRQNRNERRVLWREHAPWDTVVRALCDRVTINRDHDDDVEELVLDRCLYRATLEIVSLVTDGDGDGDDGVAECDVWVTQHRNVVEFHARERATGDAWALVYPDSVELVKEFAVETALEQQLHLEAIAMTLLLYTEAETETASRERKPIRKMRFED